MRTARALVAAILLLALACGCGSKPAPNVVPVEGVVRFEGKPLKKVAVRFVPKADDGPDSVAGGVTDDEGRFSLTFKGQPGACVGENHVLIVETPPPSNLPKDPLGHPLTGPYYESLGGRPIPRKYGNITTTPLTEDVQPGRTLYELEVKREPGER